MTKYDNSGPAFPASSFTEPCGDFNWGASGMSLRDYAAIKFAAAILANPAHVDLLHDHEHRQIIAYREADAMLVIREETLK